jgi:hypothetical protein
MERIEINGVWYVKEDTQLPEVGLNYDDITHFKGVSFEDGDICLEATRLCNTDDEGTFSLRESTIMGVDVEVTFKEQGVPMKEWEMDYMDNTLFLRGIIEGNKDSIDSLKMDRRYTPTRIQTLKSFLKHLQDIKLL